MLKYLLKGNVYEKYFTKNESLLCVIFTSNLSNDTTDYNTVAETMEELAKQQPGF